MEIPVNSYPVPSTSIFSGSSEVCSGSPISTVTAVTLPFSTFISRYLIPDNVSTKICGLSTIWWSYAYFPTQRMPLPHIAPREPSRLYISMRQSATSDGVIRINPSEPIPKWRSLTAIASFSGSFTVSSKQLT